jgi:hypothetical protein
MPQYFRQPDGTLVMTEEPTRAHPAGDAPRQADGAVIGADGLVMLGAEAAQVSPRARRPRRTAPAPSVAPSVVPLPEIQPAPPTAPQEP